MIESTIKTCTKCKKEKNINSFYKDKTHSDGFESQCKYCRTTKGRMASKRLSVRKWEENNREKYLKAQRRKDNTRRNRSPEKIRARQKLNNEIANGHITRGTCSVCDKSSNIEGHHVDYSDPCNVLWLCRKHHREAHDLIEKKGNPA